MPRQSVRDFLVRRKCANPRSTNINSAYVEVLASRFVDGHRVDSRTYNETSSRRVPDSTCSVGQKGMFEFEKL